MLFLEIVGGIVVLGLIGRWLFPPSEVVIIEDDDVIIIEEEY